MKKQIQQIKKIKATKETISVDAVEVENTIISSNDDNNDVKSDILNRKNITSGCINTINESASKRGDFEVCMMVSDPHNKIEKFDPLKKNQLYASWKNRNKDGIEGISKANSDMILRFLSDMEEGLNTAKQSKKGPRSKARILALAYHLKMIARLIEERHNKNLEDLDNRRQIHNLFEDFKKGVFKTKKGQPFQSVDDFIRDFVCFWNWNVRVIDEDNEEIDEENKRIEIENSKLPKSKKKPLKEKIYVMDVVKYLARSPKKNTFVHTTYEELQEVLPALSEDDQTVTLFLFDSIIRSPLEFSNIFFDDITFYEDGVCEVNVRDEIAKTYGRKFELVLCVDKLKSYIRRHKLKPGQRLFPHYNYTIFNKILQNAYVTTFGNKMTKGGKPFSNITGYSLRHSGSCYFRFETNVSTDKIRLRGGWSDMRRLDYYTKVVGYKGRISKAELKGHSENDMVLKLVEKHSQEKESMRQSQTQIIVELKTEYARSMEELKSDYNERIGELKEIMLSKTNPQMEVVPNA